mgnify:CR=1 FL=1
MPNKKKYIPPINVAVKAAEVFKKLEDEGFNEVDTLVLEKESGWHEQYAIFIADFDFDLDDFGDVEEGPYVTPASFDEHRFKKDFLSYLKKEFPGCKINVSYQGKEFEIIGPQYEVFYKLHFDAIEEGSSKNDGHWIFPPPAKPKRTYKRA